MSAGIRARRVVDPLPVQRAPYPQNSRHDNSITGISNAWNNIAEAKKVLKNAENRLEDAEFHRAPSLTPMSQGVHSSPPRRYVPDYGHENLSDYSPQGTRVAVDMVPSLKIGTNKTSRHDRGKPRKKVTIVDVPTPRDKYHHHQSSQPSHHPLSMNNYQPRSHLPQQPSLKQYNDPHIQRLENKMMDTRAASRSTWDGSARPTLYEDTLLRTQLREQERRAALLRTLNRPVDYQRSGDLSSPPRGVNHDHVPSTHIQLSPTSHAILNNGPTNLSIDNSTEIRVLNDIPLPQSQELHRATASLHRNNSAKHKTPNNYMSAYERLYGSQPGDKLYESQHSSQESIGHKTNELKHLERLRETIEHQKSSLVDPSSRAWHRDDDPVVVNGLQRAAITESLLSPGKAPVRKIASAPPAPVYKGFNEVETRYRMPDGSIIGQDGPGKKTTRKRSSKSARDKLHNDLNSGRDRTLQPNRSQPQHGMDSKTSQSNVKRSSKTVRKVQKISDVKKPKRPVRTGIISTTSWRDGQKAVLKVLGPAPKIQKPVPHSPPTRDTATPESVDHSAGRDQQPKSEEEESLSQHTIESEKEDEGQREERSESPVPNVDKLPSEAKDILEDLQLDSSDNESHKDHGNEKKEQIVSKAPQKKKVTRRKETEADLPAMRVRHYNANDVQKYMAKQRLDRKKKTQDDKKQRMEAEERKKEQLQELFKKQKESAKISQRPVNMVKDNRQRMDETFSKEVISAPPVDRQRSKQLDVTSSDKENKGVWSTSSSSDSSLRSSPQTDGSTELHVPQHVPRGAYSQDQGGPIEVVVTRITTDAGKANGDHRDRNVPDTIVEEDGVDVMDMAPADISPGERPQQPPAVHNAWTQPRQEPASSSKSKPRSKAERLQALKATASALQGKIESEVRKLTIESPKPKSPERPTELNLDNRWAYPAPIDVTGMGITAPSGDRTTKRVRFPTDKEEEMFPSTRYERLVGNGRDFHVFTGSLPGVSSLSEQAQVSRHLTHEADAATKIQAAYRGHTVRQRLDWKLPSGDTLKDRMQGKVPQIHVSAINEGLDSSTRTSPYSSGGEAGDSEGESLSEGPISDGSVRENLNYVPKFKHTVPPRSSFFHKPASAIASTSNGLNNTRNNTAVGIPGGIGARSTALWDRSLNDGLSVINIYTKKYQEANKGQRVYHGKLPPTASSLTRAGKSPTGYSYNEDFDHKMSTTSSQYQSSSPSLGSSPIRDLLSRDTGAPTESISYKDDFTGTSRSVSLKPDAKASGTSSKHLGKPSSRHGRRSPLGGVSDNAQNKSDADRTLNSYKSDEFDSSSSSDGEPLPRKKPLRTPSPRLRKARASSKSPRSTSLRSSPSSKSSTSQSPTSDVRKSPPRLSPSSNSRRSPHSRSKSPRSQESKAQSPSAPKSPFSKEVLSHFRPIPSSSDDGGLIGQRQEGRGVERPQPRAATAQTVPSLSNIGGTVPQAYYSPGALELKMAAELNLLESLEVSVRHLTDMERTRAISLAQQESVSLARILQTRQRDHERELQLLSLKARQEVEDANKQLMEVKQRASVTANEAERALVDARKEASESNNETARRLMESQAEAARVTAEAARQLAEARSAASQPAPIPIFDAGKMATDTATAAASAAVSAAMEQQRSHQLAMLQEMRNAVLQPLGTSTRNFGVGVSPISSSTSRPISSHGDYSSSFTSPSKTPSAVPSYSDDFTDTATQSRTRSAKTAVSSSVSSNSVATAVDESQDSAPQMKTQSSNSIKTASDLSIRSLSPGQSSKSDASIPTQSGVSEDRDVMPRSDHSSIQTVSGADTLTSTGSASVVEDIPADESVKSADYSISFNDTDSDVSKLSDASSEKSSVVSSVISFNKSKESDKRPSEGDGPSVAVGMDSFTKLSAEMLKQQLRDEEVRAQQQTALFKLREKALTEKTRAQLQLLEHEKRRLREKGAEEGLQAIKRQQKLLLTKLQQEQVEIRRLKSAQRAASRERQLLLFQQQEVIRMRREAQEVKGRMKDLPDVSLSSSIECLASEDDISVDSFDGGSNLPEVLSKSNASSTAQRLYEMESKESSRPLSAAEKQALVMQKVKKLQQPLNMRHLLKREQKLTRRKKNVEDLLAWKKRLDEEEQVITNMEEEALKVVENPGQKQSKDVKKESRPKSSEPESSPRSLPSEQYSEPRSTSSVSEAKSASEKRSQLSDVEGLSSVRDSESSIAEDLSQASSVAEEILSVKTPQRSSTSHTITEPSSDDTLKNDSPKEKYANESFESADRTITPTRSSTPISAVTPRSTHDSVITPASLLSQRKRHESESGSESERSFSQTMSETASDQSDIEGRVRALKDALRKRKMEAERLRKQQKRMNRDKLKAQEASLKKQLEAYDSLIEKTKAELKQESDVTTHSTATVKPKIKQPRVSESQRLRDQSHAKSLRQRAASETNREGIADVALRKQRSGSEGSISSRSSFDEDASRDAHTPASSASTPPTTPRHTEDGISPVHKTPSPLQSARSISSSSSMRQHSEGLDKETSYKTPSPLRSLQSSLEDDKSRPQSAASSYIPEDVESQSSASVTPSPDVSMKEVAADKPWDSKPAVVSPRPFVATQMSVDEPAARSEASDVPEDIVSVASSTASDQERVSKKDTTEDAHTKSTVSEKSAPASEIADDFSFSYSGSGRSLSRHSRQRSDKSDGGYSDDFNESSMSVDVQNQDAKSETDDDISEHLSMASEPSEKSSGQSQEILGLRRKTPEQEPEGESIEDRAPSVTVSVGKDVEQDEKEKQQEPDEQAKVSPEPTEKQEIPDELPELDIGDRVLVGGVKLGTLRFKGPTHFATGFWGGIELDEPHGSNNGTYGDTEYFVCKPEHGIFAPPEKVCQLPEDKKASPESEDESSMAEEISVAEEINSEASAHTASKSESLKSASKSESLKKASPQESPRSVGYSEEFESEQNEDERGIMEEEEALKPDTSESSMSRFSPMKSRSAADKTAEDTDEDSIAEEITDEAALEKLIHSAALAVESFSKDGEGNFEEGTEAETPRGPPETEVAVTSKDQLVDSITDHLTTMVVKDSVQAVSEIAEKHKEPEDEVSAVEKANKIEQKKDKSLGDDRSSGKLLEMLAGDEALPEEISAKEEEEEIREEIPETKGKETKVVDKVEIITSSLLKEAISDMLNLKRKKAEKVAEANKRLKDLEEDDYVELKSKDDRTKEHDAPVKVHDGDGMTTPPNQEPPEIRAVTPFTPEDSPTHRPASTSPQTPLSDDIFKSRVQIESSPDANDEGQVARPGSPVLGESSLLNPEALSERLEHLQTLDQDIGDLFGDHDQEWFDDDFHSMPKSKSMLQVPVRTPAEEKSKSSSEPSGATSPADSRRFDLKKFAEEPFYAVPHNRNDVENLVEKSVNVFYERVQLGDEDNFTNISPPQSVLGDDTKASDIESTSKKAYKKLVFDLAGEVYKDIIVEQKPTEQPPWMKPKRQPRKYFFDKPPRTKEEVETAIQDRVLNVTSLDEKPKPESTMSKFGKKKKDHVDEILTQELREEEPEWVDYDEDELAVKMQLTDAIFDSLLVDTAMVLARIQDKRKARSRPMYNSDDDLEF